MSRIHKLSIVPSVSDYVMGLTAIRSRMSDIQYRLLVTHYNAPNRALTAKKLAVLADVEGGHIIVNSQYGRLGHMYCDATGFVPDVRPNGTYRWWAIWSLGYSSREGFVWQMLPEVAEALELLQWVIAPFKKATYLLAWNPKRANWDDDIGQMSDTVQNGGTAETRWSCSNSKSIQTGDRIFFIRLGVPPKGIFASGHAIQGSYEDIHWDNDRAEKGETCRFVKVRFDRLLDPVHDNILPRETLNLPPFDSVHWDTQSSGIRIADSVATELERLWAQYAGIAKFTLPDEISYDEDVFHEGALRQVTVNAFERNTAARRKCLEIHGSCCKICDFDFGYFYGPEMDGYIHVHHLTPLAEIGEKYIVNPETDLVPVCANCHAAIHKKKPPYTLEEIRSMIHKNKAQQTLYPLRGLLVEDKHPYEPVAENDWGALSR